MEKENFNEEIGDLLATIIGLDSDNKVVSGGTQVLSEATFNMSKIGTPFEEVFDESDSSVSTPIEILDEYTEVERQKELLNIEIESLKEANKEVFSKLDELNASISELSNKQIEIKARMVESMESQGLLNTNNKFWKVTYVASTVRRDFDKAAFMKKYPVLYKDFEKITPVSAYTKWTAVKPK